MIGFSALQLPKSAPFLSSDTYQVLFFLISTPQFQQAGSPDKGQDIDIE